METNINPYFNILSRKKIDNVEELLSLNIKRVYKESDPQEEYDFIKNLKRNDLGVISSEAKPVSEFVDFRHETTGLFRGQMYDRSLVPSCYRNVVDDNLEKRYSENIKVMGYIKAMGDFEEFCKRAELQNSDFPQGLADRMSIAQHFGVKTPLLDWTHNIFVAIFFASRRVWDEGFDDHLKVYIYHILNERILHEGLPGNGKLDTFDRTAYVKPYPIDRRIERQRGAFTYHPSPLLKPVKVPVNVYIIEWDIIDKLRKMMLGFGFTYDYFFPDYAGIADGVNHDYAL